MTKSAAFSKRLVGSYVLDWLVIIATAVIGAVLNDITPYKRPFDLADPDISFPYVPREKISTVTLVLVSFVAPLGAIAVTCLALVPGPTFARRQPRKLVWRRKGWELYTGVTGLALSCASAFLITDGMKNLFGRPRPDLLSRCNADYANLGAYAVGALAPGNVALRVSHAICQNTDKRIMDDGFRSFPSGHSSFSCAGLVFLSLFLAAKFSITLPSLTPQPLARSSRGLSPLPRQPAGTAHGTSLSPRLAKRNSSTTASSSDRSAPAPAPAHDDDPLAARDQAASPPLYLLAVAVAPAFTAVYIAATRFTDFRHHAFDILFGQLIGIATAWLAFRWYHLPVRHGAGGWSWGPRSAERAFWAGVGRGVYCERAGAREVRRRGPGRDEAADVVDLEAGMGTQGVGPEGPAEGMHELRGGRSKGA